jgi:hypothetical protein
MKCEFVKVVEDKDNILSNTKVFAKDKEGGISFNVDRLVTEPCRGIHAATSWKKRLEKLNISYAIITADIVLPDPERYMRATMLVVEDISKLRPEVINELQEFN